VKALVIGGTGFTGARVVPHLDGEHDVTCLVRPGSDVARLPAGVRRVTGSMDDAAALRAALRGNELLVCIASIGFGHAPALVAAARESGIRRALFVSTTAIFTSLNARSKTVRVAAEETIAASGLEWTILRPTMIYGARGDRNMERLIRYLRRWPLIPMAGSGEHLQQPVHVDDVARAVADALRSPRTGGRAYNVSGAAPVTFNEIVDIIADLLGRRVRKLHIPLRPVVALLNAAERAHVRLPVRAEQILRLNEDKAFPHDEAVRDFGFVTRTFAQGIAAEIAELRG
jgi:nucleoside-diphosphate-sugar epimerase